MSALGGVNGAAGELTLDDVGLNLRSFRLDVTLACARWPLVLLGPSGAGKTVLLRLLAGLERPESGTIRFEGFEWARHGGPDSETGRTDPRGGVFVPPYDRPVGYCLQEPRLFPNLSVLENVAYPLANLNPRPSKKERGERALMELDRWSAGALAGSKVENLSGGEQARVALARAFVRRPRLVLLDEPLSSLDPPSREELLAMVLRETEGSRLVWVTHDRAEALALGGTMAVLLDGRIRQSGAPEEIFRQPVSPEVASFVGIGTILHGFVQARESGVMRLRCGPILLRAAGNLSPGTAVVATIRSEDVELLLPEASSEQGEMSPGHAGVSQNAGAPQVQTDLFSQRAAPGGAPARRTSARNEIEVTVAGVRPWGMSCLVDLRAGSESENVLLSAAITRASCDELGITAGKPMLARIKALAVQVRSEAWQRAG